MAIRSTRRNPTKFQPTAAGATRSPLVRAITATPRALFLGYDPVTKQPVSVSLSRLKTNLYLKAATGGGKTSILSELHFALGFAPNPGLHFDYIGTGFAEVQAYVAFTATLLKMIEKLYRQVPLRMAEGFLQRYAFVLLSNRARSETGIDLPVRIDLLKRRFINGRRESTAEVIDRVIRMFDMRFSGDMALRVQFQRVATAVLSTLISAALPLKRWEEVLRGGDVMQQVRRNQERFGTAADPYVQTQMHELSKLHAMLGGKSTRDFDLATNSTTNALADYRPGTLLGEFFADETFDPAQVVFGGSRLFISTDVSNTLLRRESFLALYSLFGSLIAGRAGSVSKYPQLLEVIDEIAWVPESLATDLAQVRNLGVTMVLAHQASAQWRQYGLDYMPDMIGALFPTRLEFRPTTFDEARNLALVSQEVDPAVFIERYTTSTGTGESVTETITDSWQEMLSDQQSITHGTSRPESFPGDDAPPRTTASNGLQDGRGHSSGSGGSVANAAGRSWTETISQQLYRVGFDEQVSLSAQGFMRRAKYEATLIEDGRGRDVQLAPPRKFPSRVLGIDIGANYKALHDAYWRSRADMTAVEVPLNADGAAVSPVATDAIEVVETTPRPAEVLRSAAQQVPEAELESRIVHSGSAPIDPRAPTLTMTDRALLSAAWLRHTGGQQVMLLNRAASYDGAMRALAKLTASGDLAQVRPPAAKGAGSAPILFNLTEKGARRLADLDLFNLDDGRRLARSVLAQKRAVEEGAPSLVRHQRYVGWNIALLAAHVDAGGGAIESVAWDPAITVDLRDVLPKLSDPATKRLAPAAPGELVYRPDALVIVRWTTGTTSRREPFLIEVETNFGEQPQTVIGEAKSACIAAILKRLRETGYISTVEFTRRVVLRVIVWHRREDAAARFLDGASRVERGIGMRLPVLVTSGDTLPLWLPARTAKRDIRSTLDALAAKLAEPVFRTVGSPTRRPLLLAAADMPEQGNA